MHDGQNLFDPAVSGMNKVWAVDRKVTELVAAGTIDPVIVVGVWNPGAARARTYLPQPLFDALNDADRAAVLRFANGAPQSRAYIDFLAGPLNAQIDREFRTLPGRAHTAIGGSSMGGIVSLYAFAEYPRIYGAALCLSTHWPLAVPVAGAGPDPARVRAAWTEYLTRRLGRPDGRRIWFDHGTATLDAYYAPYQQAVDALLPRLGWRRGRDVESRVYPGAEHEENAWARRLGDPLSFALRRR